MPRSQENRYGDSSRRLLELKPVVDRIIADCRVDGGQIKSGLDVLRNYQLDIMEELEGRGYRDGQEPYGDYSQDPVHDIRRQNARLLKDLKTQIGHSNHLAGNVNRLQDQVKRLRRDQGYDQGYVPRQRNIHKSQEPNQGQYYEEQVRRNYRQDPSPMNSYHGRNHNNRGVDFGTSGSQQDSRDDIIRSLQAENSRLKAQVRDLQYRLQETENKLRKSQSKNGLGYVREQLDELKRQNQQLRQNTIKLLNDKSYSGPGGDSQLRRQLDRLHQQIEQENQLKEDFLQELTKFKNKYKRCEEEKRVLEQELRGGRGGDRANYIMNASKYDVDTRQRVSGPGHLHYGNNPIDKYKNLLQEMRTKS